MTALMFLKLSSKAEGEEAGMSNTTDTNRSLELSCFLNVRKDIKR